MESTYDDMADLLASVLGDETPDTPEPPQPDDDGPDVPDGTDAEGFPGGDERMAEDGGDEGDEGDEPLSSPTPPVDRTTDDGELSPPEHPDEPDEPDEIDEIDRLIAEAAGETVEEPEPEPEPETPDSDESDDDQGAATAAESDDVTQCVNTNQVFSKGAGDDAIPIPTFTDEDVMDQIDIRNFGTLVTLRTNRWHAKIKDRKAAKDAASASGADASAFEAQKHLLAGADEKLKAVHKAIDAARKQHYEMTLPWSTVGVNEQGKRAGARLLPNTLFMEYTAGVAQAKQEMKDALKDFVSVYPQLIQVAQAKLGSAFNQSEYPPANAIGSYFGLDFDFMPIPKGSDFDGLQGQQAQKLASALNNRTRTMLENAMQDAWSRLYETVTHAYSRLSNPDALFHYTMVDKLRDQASMLQHLNVTGDQRIEDIRAAVEAKLTKHDVKDIREDDALRKRMAEDAGAIVEQMKEFADGN